MRTIRDFHHYRESEIPSDDRVSRLEKRVVDLLLTSKLKENERDSSVAFELKHSSATTQFARLLARKRDLNEEMCAAGAALHDIYVIVHGKYKDHARLAEPIARELLISAGFRHSAENETIIQLIINHSDKHVFSCDPYIEFGKDADVLDCFLYPDAVEYYLRHKPIAHMFHYLGRAKSIWSDLGITKFPNFLTLLDGYHPDWLGEAMECSPVALVALLSSPPEALSGIPNFLIRIENGLTTIYFNREEAKTKAAASSDARAVDGFRDLLRSALTGSGNLLDYHGGSYAQSVNSEVLYDYLLSRGISPADTCGIMVWAPVGILEPIPSTASGIARLQELTGAVKLPKTMDSIL